MKNRMICLLLVLSLCAFCSGCGREPTSQDPTVGNGAPAPTHSMVSGSLSSETGDHFSDRDLDDTVGTCVEVTLADGGSTASGVGVTVQEDTVVITKAGSYRLSGTLSNGQVRVQVGDEEKVQLVLDGASITCHSSAALYVRSGDKVFVTLAQGSENTLSTTEEFTQTDENAVDGAVFSKSDLTFNGKGTLTVQCATGHGIVSKDDLKFTGGTYQITAAKQGLSGKDALCFAGGDFTVESGTDGLHAKNEEETDKGYLYISGGTFRITAGNDGMDASGEVRILDGDITITTGEGSASVTHSDGSWGGGMMPGWDGPMGEQGSNDSNTESRKAIKSGSTMHLMGGNYQLDGEDDALHSNGDMEISGGSFALASGDDAIHAEQILLIRDGTIRITKSYEGLEGTYITVSGGDIQLEASDDGMNAAGGNDGSGMAGPWGGGGGFGEATDAYIRITGGSLTLCAGGDGIDSNGDLTVSGGEVYVHGPTNSGNGSLDYAGEASITGGTFIAVGAAGMAMNFGNSSTQGAILCGLNGTAPVGTEVSVRDSSGKVLASCVAQKNFQSILISAPGMAAGNTYTVVVGTVQAEFSLSSAIYGSGSGMGGGMGGHRPGGRP